MRRGGLFRRFFTAIAAAMLVTVLIFSGLMATSLRRERRIAYENEVRLQAREIADYMTNLNKISSIVANMTLQYIVRWKMEDIHARYNADIWIVSFSSGIAQVLDSSWNTSDGLFNRAVTEQLERIKEGSEIREKGLFPELGEQIVTIGVPWTYSDGSVVGAVLLHISTDELDVNMIELLMRILPATIVTLLISIVISVLLTRSQIKPLHEIESAVREFSKGDLSRRVDLHCGGELETLGHSINRMAEELSQLEDSRRSFVAAVSHELRSPLTCMRGYVEAMQDGTIPPEEIPKYLQIVMDETNRLTDLVRDLLDMSRLESGKFPLQIAPFNANELIRRILINFEPRIEDKSIDVDVQFANDECWVSGDAGRINQVLSNLIDNALKFLNPEGHLSISTRQVGQEVRFSVANDGPCISEKDLPHIFERFYKADKAHTSGGGTGLGLAICRMIIREHRSDISVTSEPGRTEFTFTLPADAPSKDKGKSADTSAS